HTFYSAQLAGGRAREQLLIWHGIPQKIRESAGNLEVCPLGGRSSLHAKEKVRRLQHRLDHELGSGKKFACSLGLANEQCVVSLRFTRGQRSSEGALSELADEPVAAGGMQRRGRL